MTSYLAWLVPTGLAIGLGIHTARSRKSGSSPRTNDGSTRLIWAAILILACMVIVLWLIVDALSETSLHEFTIPAILALMIVAGFATIRITR